MSDADNSGAEPGDGARQMKKNGVTHVVWLPDSETNWLYLLMKAEPSLRLVGVSREGHASRSPPGSARRRRKAADPDPEHRHDGIRAIRSAAGCWACNVPVVLMVGYRGWTRHGVNTDTAATYTERFLMAFGINYYLVENDADAPRISVAFEEAERTKRPVVCWSATNITASTGKERAHDAHREMLKVSPPIAATRSSFRGAAAATG